MPLWYRNSPHPSVPAHKPPSRETVDEAPTGKLKQAVVRPDPQSSFAVFINSPHKAIRQAARRGIGLEDAVVVPEQTATLRAGPQTPVTRNGQAENTVFVYLWRVS